MQDEAMSIPVGFEWSTCCGANQRERVAEWDGKRWVLCVPYGWDVWHHEINYCPFCGARLRENWHRSGPRGIGLTNKLPDEIEE